MNNTKTINSGFSNKKNITKYQRNHFDQTELTDEEMQAIAGAGPRGGWLAIAGDERSQDFPRGGW